MQSNHVNSDPDNPQIDLDYTLVFNAIQSVLGKKQISISEDMLINAIKGKKIKTEDLDAIVRLLDTHSQPMTLLRIYIAEKKKDFILSFKLNLGSSALRR